MLKPLKCPNECISLLLYLTNVVLTDHNVFIGYLSNLQKFQTVTKVIGATKTEIGIGIRVRSIAATSTDHPPNTIPRPPAKTAAILTTSPVTRTGIVIRCELDSGAYSHR